MKFNQTKGNLTNGLRPFVFHIATAGVLSAFFVCCTVSAEDLARKSPISDDLMSVHLTFDDTLDSAVSPLNGTPSLIGKGDFTKGIVNKALLLGDGDTGYLKAPIEAGQLDLKKGTIMFWFKPEWSGNDNPGKLSLLWITIGKSEGYFAFHRSFNKERPELLFVTVSNKNGLSVDINSAFERDKWMHLAFTWDAEANECILYLNGDPVAKGSWQNLPNDESMEPAVLSLGRYYSGDLPINGSYDDLFIFRKNLSPDEIFKYVQDCQGSP